MRPKCQVLRYAFRAAKASLDAKNEKTTIRTLAGEMTANFKSVQHYLYRNRDLATEIGVELEYAMHDVGQYADAIVDMPANQRPTQRRIAAALGIDHSSVSKFMKKHPELRALHPRFDNLRGNGKAVEIEIASATTPAKPNRWRDLGVAIWHENVGRYVGVCATREEYLDYWEKGLLKHQCEGKPKPEHLPTPEEVSRMS